MREWKMESENGLCKAIWDEMRDMENNLGSSIDQEEGNSDNRKHWSQDRQCHQNYEYWGKMRCEVLTRRPWGTLFTLHS
jgi:hypothetical protein